MLPTSTSALIHARVAVSRRLYRYYLYGLSAQAFDSGVNADTSRVLDAFGVLAAASWDFLRMLLFDAGYVLVKLQTFQDGAKLADPIARDVTDVVWKPQLAANQRRRTRPG
jgi:tRNA U38,U39,U40 pseudouridine synthase TruA